MTWQFWYATRRCARNLMGDVVDLVRQTPLRWRRRWKLHMRIYVVRQALAKKQADR